MASVPKRGRNIVVKTQFNINGSRGKNVGSFISDYVARDEATNAYSAYVPNVREIPQVGDGVAFTLDESAITKKETLRLADHVQSLHEEGNRAIQQIVISFAPDYLVDQQLVPRNLSVMSPGDYQYNYDDVRLRHAVRAGIHSMIENEDYHDAQMVAAIQTDTMHIHAHVVVYEDFPKLSRMYGKEERGILRESSLNRLSFHIDRELSATKDPSIVITERMLTPEHLDNTHKRERVQADGVDVDMTYMQEYLRLLKQKAQEEMLAQEGILDELTDDIILSEVDVNLE